MPAGRPRGTVHVTPEADPALLPVPLEAPLVPARRGFRWGAHVLDRVAAGWSCSASGSASPV